MTHKKPFILAIKGLILGMGLLCIPTGFATINDISGVPTKAAGDRFLYTEFNDMVDMLRNFFRDDNNTTGDLTDDKVGIGISTPQALLDVGETTDPSVGVCPTGYKFVDYDTDTNVEAGECWRGFVALDGDVGIGTVTPSSDLHIYDPSDDAFLFVDTAGTSKQSGIQFSDGGTGAWQMYKDQGATGSFVIRDFGSADVVTIANGAGANSLTVSSSSEVGMGIASPEGTLHVWTAESGAAESDGNADELVLENSDNAGITILTPNTKYGQINFGDPEDDNIGRIRFDHLNSSMRFHTAGATEAMRILSTGYVGIGTTTPDRFVHFEEGSSLTSSAVPGLRLTRTSTGTPAAGLGTGIDFEVETTSGNNEVLGIIEGIATTVTSTAEVGALVFKTMDGGATADEKMRIAGDGKVGIGTSNPFNKFHVLNSADDDLILRVDGADVASEYISLGVQSGYAVITAGYQGSGDNALVFKTSATSEGERMRIDKDGNVGIGTTSPTALLNVSGPAGAPGAVDLSTEELTVVDGDVLGKIEFDAPLESDGTDAILVGAAIEAVAEGTFSATNNATELIFKTGASEAATQKMVLTSGGNVGIGTVSPARTLSVDGGSGNIVGKIDSSDAGSYIEFLDDTTGAAQVFLGARSTNLALFTSGTEKLTIDSSGLIGIGTTAPTAQLHTKGNLSTALTGTVAVTATETAVTGTSTLFTTELKVGDSIKIGTETFTVSAIGSATALTLDSAHAAGASGATAYTDPNLFSLDNGDGTAKVIVDNSGHMGIGVTPTTAGLSVGSGSVGLATSSDDVYIAGNLEVDGNVQLGDDMVLDNVTVLGTLDIQGEMQFTTGDLDMADSKIVNIGAAGTDFTDTGGLTLADDLAVDSTDFFVDVSAGNVGIGTATPSEMLDIRNDGDATIKLAKSDGDQSLVLIGGNGGTQLIQSAYHLGVDTGGARRMTIESTGNVGIGTTSPGAKLEVVKKNDYALILNSYDGSLSGWSGLELARADGTVTGEIGRINVRARAFNGVDTSASRISTLITTASTGGEITSALTFSTSNSASPTERMRIDSSGNVGINTLAPTNLLSVTPAQYSTGTASQSTTAITGVGTTFTSAMVGSQFVFADGTSAGTITAFGSTTSLTVSASQTVSSQAYKIAYTGLQVGSTGNVGVGTTSPTFPSSSSTKTLHISDDAGAALRLEDSNSNGDWVLYASGTSFKIWDEIDNADRFTIDTSGNVGIGTTSPGAKLEVLGSISSDQLRITNLASYPYKIGRNQTTGFLDFQGSQAGYTGYSFKNDDGSVDLTILDNGNVGIGTTSPAYKLDVEDTTGQIRVKSSTGTNYALFRTTNTGGDLYFGRENSAGGGLATGTTAYAGVINARGSYPFQIAVNDNIGMTMLDGGSVGLNTTSPTAQLHLKGSLSTALTGTVDVTAASTTVTGTTTAFDTELAVADSIKIGSEIFTISAIASATSLTLDSAHSAGATGATAYTDPNLFELDNGDSVGKFIVDNSGNVGVGTVSPVRPLNLYGASDTGLALQSGTTGATTGDGFLLSLAATTNDVGLLNYENSDIFFRTAAVERMRIMNDGNVGIGTTSPGEKLDVRVSDNNYGLRITAPMSGNDVYNGIKFGYDGGTLTNDYYLGEIKAWKRSGGGGDLIFNSASSSSAFNSDQLVLAKNGNIGINTLAPTNLLSVTPAQYSTGTASQSTTAITGVGTTFTSAMVGSQFVFADGTSAGTITAFGSTTSLTVSASQTVSSQAYKIAYTGLQVDGTGQVGVGTSSPGADLDVEGTGTGLYFRTLRGDSLGYFTISHGADRTNFNSYSDYTFNTQDTERVRITGAGNVGIGTTSPGDALEVSGNVYATAFNSIGALSRYNGTGGLAIAGVAGATYAYISAYSDSGGTGKILALQKDGGNIGIGTVTPSALLNVSGPAGAPGAVDLSTEELTVADGDVLGKIEFDAPLESSGTDSILVGAAIEAVAEGDFTTSSNATELVFKTGASEAATQKMVITSGGNVGIGTASPSTSLHITGATGDGAINIWNNAESQKLRIDQNSIRTEASHDLSIYTSGNTSQLVLDQPTGNVGIGTTSPGAKLEVAGEIRLAENSSLKWGTTGTRIIGNTNYMRLQTGAIDKLNIETSGIGINTTSPTAVLHTKGNLTTALTGTVTVTASQTAVTGLTTAFDTELAVGDAIKIGSEVFTVSAIADATHLTLDSAHSAGAAGATAYTDPNLLAIDNGDGTNEITVDNSGNIGLGTTTPGAPVHMYADTSTGHELAIEQDGTGDAQIRYTLTGLKTWVTGADNSDGDKFKISESTALGTSDRFTVDVGGKVGIGDTSPTAGLTVGDDTGNVNATGADDVYVKGNLEVDGSVWLGDAVSDDFTVQGTLVVTGDTSYDGDWNMNSNIISNIGAAGTDFTTTGGLTLADDLAVDTSDLFVDVSAGKVGIGTATPFTPLELSSTDPTIRLYDSDGVADKRTFEIRGIGAEGYESLQFRKVNDANSVYTELFNLDESGVASFPAGNVGIGTTSPTNKLELYKSDTSTTYPGIKIEQAGTGDAGINFLITGNYNWGVGVDNSDGDKFKISNSQDLGSTPRLTIDTSGLLGIGTTSPTAQLHLKGSLSTALTGTVDVTAASTTVTGTTTAFDTELAVGDSIKIGSEIFTISAIASATSLTLDSAHSAGASAVTAYTDPNLFELDNGDSVGKFIVDNSGNVGVGTVSPGAGLHVDSTWQNQIIFQETGQSNYAELSSGSAYVGIYTGGDSSRQMMRLDHDGSAVSFNTGNVGIGTTSPGALLHLSSASPKIQLTDTDTNADSFIDVDSGYGSIGISADANNEVATSQINLLVDGSSKMVIKDTGNVGIGTTSPGEKLEVVGGNIILKSTPSEENRILLYGGGSDTDYGAITIYDAYENANIKFDSYAQGVNYINSGNVGIGTTSPLSKLHIVGGAATGADTPNSGTDHLVVDDDTNSFINLRTPSGYNQAILFSPGTRGAGSIGYSGSTNLMSFGSTGNFNFTTGSVGIGTTSPLTTLDVAGSARIKGSATSVLTGTIDPAASTTVTGVGTAFTTELVVGDRITVTGETRTVTAIATTTSLTVDTAFTDNANDTTPDKLAATLIAKDSSDNVDFIVSDQGYVGVGTNSPGKTLDINGDARIRGDDGALNFYRATSPTDIARIKYDNTAGSMEFWARNKNISFSSTDSDDDAPHLFIESTTGNVGVGTASPSEELHVEAANPKILLTSSSDSAYQVGLQANWDSGHQMTLTGVSGSEILGQYAGNTALPYGNIGLGTTSPLTKLDVAGSARIKGTATSVLTGTIDPAASTTVTGVGTAFTTELVVGDRITVTGETRTVTAIATTTSLTVDTAFTDNANDTAPDKLAAELIIKDSSDNVDFIVSDQGYVGIGTVSPGEILEVNGDLLINYADSSHLTKLSYGNSDSNPFLSSKSTGEYGWTFYNRSTEGDLAINRNVGTAQGVEALRIQRSTGNVGIGTTSPDYNLEIEGATNPVFGIKDTTNDVLTKLQSLDSEGLVGTESNHDFQIRTNNNIVTTFDSSGNVGIGTTSPARKLEVSSASYQNSRFTRTGAANLGLALELVNSDGNIATINHGGDESISFVTSSANTPIFMKDDGNVGISTTSPLTKLDVAGSARIKGTATSVLTGTIDPAASTTVTGVGTAFTTELVVGDRITVTGETRTVTAIATTTSLTVDTAFTDNANDTAPDKLAATLIIKDSSDNVDFIVSDQGYVGVGTGSPETKLTIGDLTVNTELRIKGIANTADNGASLGLFESANGINGGRVRYDGGTNTLNILGVNGSGTESLGVAVARDSGNVGIGTTSPTTTLDVSGTVTATAFAGPLTGAVTGNASTATALAANPTDCPASMWARTIDASGNLSCSTIGYAGISAMTSANFATIISDETGTGLAVFGTSPTLTTPVLGVATGTSLDLGGTSLFASRALTVDTGGVFDISTGSASGDDFTINTTQFAIEGDTGQVGIGTASPGGMLTIWNSTGTDFQIVHDGDNWATIDSGASGLLTFNTRTTANAEGAFAFMNGNVGINTTSPLTKLDVAGSSRIKGSATSVLTGTIDPAASTTVTGVGTAFTTELVVGDRITVTGETRTVTAIATTTSLTVDTAFTDNANDTAPDKLAAQLIIKDSSDNVDFIVQDNGYVGIGTATPAELLDVEGNIEADAYLYSSDRALKKEITTITNPLDKVRALRGVNFKWKADDVASIGFIAQEVESVIPEIVSTHDTDGLKAVQYGNITALLVEAMKAQQVQIEELQETVENLQSSILNLQ